MDFYFTQFVMVTYFDDQIGLNLASGALWAVSLSFWHVLIILWVLPYFLTQLNVSGSACTSASAPEPFFSSRRVVYRNQDLSTRCAHCCWDVATPSLLGITRKCVWGWGGDACIYVCVYPLTFIFIYMSICIINSDLAKTAPIHI